MNSHVEHKNGSKISKSVEMMDDLIQFTMHLKKRKKNSNWYTQAFIASSPFSSITDECMWKLSYQLGLPNLINCGSCVICDHWATRKVEN